MSAAPTDTHAAPGADLTGRTVFVTGGTGFLGSHLVEALLAAGCAAVRCLVRSDQKWLEGLPVEIIPGDLDDDRAMERGVSGADIVFHAAARTRARTWEAFEHANVSGSTRLLDAVDAAGARSTRVILTSSLAVVGRADAAVADETTPLDPVSMYGRSKQMMEREAGRYTDRVDLVIVRPPAVYGPREQDILTFFRSMNYGVCPIVGSGYDRLSLVHVRDVVHGMLCAAVAPAASGRTWFIGPATQASWHEVRDAVRAATGRAALTVPVPKGLVRTVGAVVESVTRPFGIHPPLNREKAEEITTACLMCDSSRAITEIGYAPSVGLETGIRETIAWYREHGWL